MTTHSLPSPSRWRTSLAWALALLVQGIWLLLLQPDRPHIGQASGTLLTLRFFADRSSTPDRFNSPRRERAARPAEHAAPVLRSTPPPALVHEANTSTPAAPTAPPTATAGSNGEPAPLNLKLYLPMQRPTSAPKPESVVSQALRDPRSNSPKLTVEQAIADAAGTLPETTSESTDGTGARLTRKGSKCTRERDSRSRVLNPMDEGLRNIPAMAGKC